MLSSHTLTEKNETGKDITINAGGPVLAIRPSFLVVESVVSKSILEDLHKDTTNTAIEEN